MVRARKHGNEAGNMSDQSMMDGVPARSIKHTHVTRREGAEQTMEQQNAHCGVQEQDGRHDRQSALDVLQTQQDVALALRFALAPVCA
jgi:hypothetical protein